MEVLQISQSWLLWVIVKIRKKFSSLRIHRQIRIHFFAENILFNRGSQLFKKVYSHFLLNFSTFYRILLRAGPLLLPIRSSGALIEYFESADILNLIIFHLTHDANILVETIVNSLRPSYLE